LDDFAFAINEFKKARAFDLERDVFNNVFLIHPSIVISQSGLGRAVSCADERLGEAALDDI
jgi:hypothetical protein